MALDAGAWPTGAHIFLDETKERDYTLVAVSVVASDVATVRSEVRRLRHKGAKSIHMRKEGDQSRNRIIAGLLQLPVQAHVIESADRSLNDLERRFQCLKYVLDMCARSAAARLTIELDQSIVKRERQFLVEEVRRWSLPSNFHYDWLARDQDALLWVSDVVAWSHARGGRWRAAVSPLVYSHRRV